MLKWGAVPVLHKVLYEPFIPFRRFQSLPEGYPRRLNNRDIPSHKIHKPNKTFIQDVVGSAISAGKIFGILPTKVAQHKPFIMGLKKPPYNIWKRR
jgi:hypothetical protein